MSKKKADTVKESKIAFSQKVVGLVLEKEYEEFSEMFEVFKNLTNIHNNEIWLLLPSWGLLSELKAIQS